MLRFPVFKMIHVLINRNYICAFVPQYPLVLVRPVRRNSLVIAYRMFSEDNFIGVVLNKLIN